MRRAAIVAGALGAAVLAALLYIRPAQATLHHAALVIQHSGGGVLTRCVSFMEDQISGLQLIQRSGVQYQVRTFGTIGTAVCQLDNEPTPVPSSCFGAGPYWQYSHRTAAGWQPSGVAASAWVLRDGDMDGWRYAAGAAQTPPPIGFASVCTPVVSSAAASHPASPATAIRSTAAAPTQTQPAIAAPATAATSPSSSAQALAPTMSATPRMALAETGPQDKAAPGPPITAWLLLGGGSISLIALGAVNLARRRR